MADYQQHEFGINDPWGRSIGACVMTWTRSNPDGLRTDYPFALKVQATRNAIAYGPRQDDRYFPTAEDRSAAIAKYLRGAKRNAVKIAARGTLKQREGR